MKSVNKNVTQINEFDSLENENDHNMIKKLSVIGLLIVSAFFVPNMVHAADNNVEKGTGQGLAIGSNSEANGVNSLAVGGGFVGQYFTDGHPDPTGEGTANSIAIGTGSKVTTSRWLGDTSTNSIAIGNNSTVSGSNSSIVIGDNAKSSSADNSIVLGTNASTFNSPNAVAIGSDASVLNKNSVALGANSKTNRDNSVSIGSVENERQLTNLKAGTEDTDAVNVKQLNDKVNETLNSANSYTNTQVTENNKVINKSIDDAKKEAIKQGQDAATTAEKNANAYTDSKVSNIKNEAVNESNSYTDKKVSNIKNEAVSESNSYTDSKVTENNTHIINNLKNVVNNYSDSKVANIKNEVVSESNSYTDIKLTENNNVINKNIDNSKKEAISISNNYTNNKFNQLQVENDSRFNAVDSKINRNARQANAGIASVTAIASIPYKTDINTPFSFGMGLGNYRSGNAIAAGAQYQIRDNVNLRANVSWNDTDSAVIGGGIAFSY